MSTDKLQELALPTFFFYNSFLCVQRLTEAFDGTSPHLEVSKCLIIILLKIISEVSYFKQEE